MADGRIEIITGRERRRRWSVAEKLRIVAESEAPGASVVVPVADNVAFWGATAGASPAEVAAAHHHGEHDALDGPEVAAMIEQHGDPVSDSPGGGVAGHAESVEAGRHR